MQFKAMLFKDQLHNIIFKSTNSGVRFLVKIASLLLTNNVDLGKLFFLCSNFSSSVKITGIMLLPFSQV